MKNINNYFLSKEDTHKKEKFYFTSRTFFSDVHQTSFIIVRKYFKFNNLLKGWEK